MKAYRIIQWHTHHESPESKKYLYLRWVLKPNKHDGMTWRLMVKQQDRCELLAAWVIFLDLASRLPRGQRGWLVRNNQPLTPQGLELLTDFPAPVFERALQFFSSPEAGWLVEQEFAPSPQVPGDSPQPSEEAPQTSGDSPQSHPPDRKGRDGNSLEREKKGPPDSRTQWAVRARRIKHLLGRADDLSPSEQKELLELQAEQEKLEKRQARGDFSTGHDQEASS